jgi:hypothetical protein
MPKTCTMLKGLANSGRRCLSYWLDVKEGMTGASRIREIGIIASSGRTTRPAVLATENESETRPFNGEIWGARGWGWMLVSRAATTDEPDNLQESGTKMKESERKKNQSGPNMWPLSYW